MRRTTDERLLRPGGEDAESANSRDSESAGGAACTAGDRAIAGDNGISTCSAWDDMAGARMVW
jgi:hypothetical protein